MFENATRDDGSKFVRLIDTAPEWLTDAVHEAHDGKLPTDWIFEECRAAYEACVDGSLTSDDGVHEHADSQVDIYTANRFAWAAEFCCSNLFSRAEDEASEVGTGDTANDRIGLIQYYAITAIASVIVQAFEAHANDDTDTDDTDDTDDA